MRMLRLYIRLPLNLQNWVESKARERQVSLASVVRSSIEADKRREEDIHARP